MLARDADDHEEQDVENAALDLDGREKRAWALFPTIDADVRVGEELAELVRHVELVDLVVPELDLESGAAVLHAANGLELFERHVDEARVVLAHLGLHGWRPGRIPRPA